MKVNKDCFGIRWGSAGDLVQRKSVRTGTTGTGDDMSVAQSECPTNSLSPRSDSLAEGLIEVARGCSKPGEGR